MDKRLEAAIAARLQSIRDLYTTKVRIQKLTTLQQNVKFVPANDNNA